MKEFLRLFLLDFVRGCPYCGKWWSRKTIAHIDYFTDLVRCKYCNKEYEEDLL